MKNFNVAGPSVAGQHYMIDPLSRVDLPEIEMLIGQQRYFVPHAPRQTGKTGLRGGDALHPAIAANHGASKILTLDEGLLSAGKQLKLPVSRGIKT